MIVELFRIIVLGIVAGFSQIFPISEQTHLAIFERLLSVHQELISFYEIILNGGIMIAIMIYYRRELRELTKQENHQTVYYLIIGTLLLIFPGLIFKLIFTPGMAYLWISGIGLLVTAYLIRFIHRPETEDSRELVAMTWQHAVFIGLAQCGAYIPGVSRMGAIIALASRLGYRHESAVKFSLFLALPPLAGAIIFNAFDLLNDPSVSMRLSGEFIYVIILGIAASASVGYAAISILLNSLKSLRFQWFSYYCLVMAALLFIFSMV